MQLYELSPDTKNKKSKRVGRGGKRGTYSGRGMKGQSSRAGRKIRPAIRDLIQRTPKLRGAGNKAARYKKVSNRKKAEKTKKTGNAEPKA